MDNNINELQKLFLNKTKNLGFASLRFFTYEDETINLRKGIPENISRAFDSGFMVFVVKGPGYGYGATSELTPNGLEQALNSAIKHAEFIAKHPLVDFSKIKMPSNKGEYRSKVKTPWNKISLNEKIDLMKEIDKSMRTNTAILDTKVGLSNLKLNYHYITSQGGETKQELNIVNPYLSVVANKGIETLRRSSGDFARQGGLEVLEQIDFKNTGKRLSEEVLELLSAPNCPTGTMDLLLDSTQMILQIHESIGHPLELDRILGDERNYAGTSFVTPDMVGSYKYGSELLNIAFDPTIENEMAAYKYDDDGNEAKKELLIEKGILKKVLGSNISQARSGLKGVANSRATSWNRPPIDRMANLNLEPGKSTLEEMIKSVEKGVYMKTNTSWSIDDSRNKFQFGCEWGRLIENGKLTNIVKKPNYRGISATFWRNLKMVGNKDTFGVHGVPNCGKGEPNQIMFVGHATPTALFDSVEVFGGAA